MPDERQAQARIEFTDATIESLPAAPTTLGSQGGVNVNRAVLPDSAWDSRLEIGGAPSRGGRACSDSARDTAQRFASGGTDPELPFTKHFSSGAGNSVGGRHDEASSRDAEGNLTGGGGLPALQSGVRTVRDGLIIAREVRGQSRIPEHERDYSVNEALFGGWHDSVED